MMQKLFQKWVALNLAFLLATASMAQSIGGGRFASTEQDRIARIKQNLHRAVANYQAQPRQDYMTVGWLVKQIESTGTVNACTVLSIVQDENYIASLDAKDKFQLLDILPFIENKGNGCGLTLLNLTFEKMLTSPYNMQETEISNFYVLSISSLGMNKELYSYVYDRLLSEIDKASLRTNSAEPAAYPVQILMDLLAYDEYRNEVGLTIPPQYRRQIERRIETLIGQFDYLKDLPAEYVLKVALGRKVVLISAAEIFALTPGASTLRLALQKIKPSSHVGKFIKSALLTETGILQRSNQDVLFVLFAQAGSGFANAVDDPIVMKFFSTGGFNFAENNFLEDRHDFYVRPPIPGADEKGGFTPTYSGYKHLVLSCLVRALGYSYSFAFQETAEQNFMSEFPIPHHPTGKNASEQMNKFIRHYLQTNSKGEFEHYLYIPLEMMEVGKEELYHLGLGDMNKHLGGWDPEYEENLRQIFHALKHNSYYPMYSFSAFAQGMGEVAAEWSAVGKFLGLAGKGISKAWVKYMPKRARVVLRNVVTAPKKGAYKVAGKNYRVAKHARWAEQRIERDLDVLRKQGLVDIPGAMRQKWLDHGWATKEEVREIVYNYFTERTGIPVIRVGI